MQNCVGLAYRAYTYLHKLAYRIKKSFIKYQTILGICSALVKCTYYFFQVNCCSLLSAAGPGRFQLILECGLFVLKSNKPFQRHLEQPNPHFFTVAPGYRFTDAL